MQGASCPDNLRPPTYRLARSAFSLLIIVGWLYGIDSGLSAKPESSLSIACSNNPQVFGVGKPVHRQIGAELISTALGKAPVDWNSVLVAPPSVEYGSPTTAAAGYHDLPRICVRRREDGKSMWQVRLLRLAVTADELVSERVS